MECYKYKLNLRQLYQALKTLSILVTLLAELARSYSLEMRALNLEGESVKKYLCNRGEVCNVTESNYVDLNVNRAKIVNGKVRFNQEGELCCNNWRSNSCRYNTRGLSLMLCDPYKVHNIGNNSVINLDAIIGTFDKSLYSYDSYSIEGDEQQVFMQLCYINGDCQRNVKNGRMLPINCTGEIMLILDIGFNVVNYIDIINRNYTTYGCMDIEGLKGVLIIDVKDSFSTLNLDLEFGDPCVRPIYDMMLDFKCSYHETSIFNFKKMLSYLRYKDQKRDVNSKVSLVIGDVETGVVTCPLVGFAFAAVVGSAFCQNSDILSIINTAYKPLFEQISGLFDQSYTIFSNLNNNILNLQNQSNNIVQTISTIGVYLNVISEDIIDIAREVGRIRGISNFLVEEKYKMEYIVQNLSNDLETFEDAYLGDIISTYSGITTDEYILSKILQSDSKYYDAFYIGETIMVMRIIDEGLGVNHGYYNSIGESIKFDCTQGICSHKGVVLVNCGNGYKTIVNPIVSYNNNCTFKRDVNKEDMTVFSGYGKPINDSVITSDIQIPKDSKINFNKLIINVTDICYMEICKSINESIKNVNEEILALNENVKLNQVIDQNDELLVYKANIDDFKVKIEKLETIANGDGQFNLLNIMILVLSILSFLFSILQCFIILRRSFS